MSDLLDIFCSLERRNFVNKTIYRLRLRNGEITTDPARILQEQEKFYRSLYTSKGSINREYITESDIIFPKISEEDFELLEADITSEEIGIALKALALGKSPGTDGLPADFYKFFYKKIKETLYQVYIEDIKKGKLHLSTQRGIISLLEKQGKDGLELKSWRPLTLLNTDYKIISKVLATRLKVILEKIVHSDQTGFLP